MRPAMRKGNLPALAGTVGAGLDYMATDRIAIRAEYLYSHSLVEREHASRQR